MANESYDSSKHYPPKKLSHWNAVKITSFTKDGKPQISSINIKAPDKEHECLFGVRNPLICIKCPKHNQCVSLETEGALDESELGCCGNVRCSDDIYGCLLCAQCTDKDAYRAKIEASGAQVAPDMTKEKIYRIMNEFNQGRIGAQESIQLIEAVRRGEDVTLSARKTVQADPIVEQLRKTINDFNQGLLTIQQASSNLQTQTGALIKLMEEAVQEAA
jgi:hypothetical protein